LESILQDTSGIKKGLSSEWPRISLDYNKKSIHGYSGCNSFGGDFSLRNDSLKLGPITANEKGCLHSVEASLFAQLRRVNRYSVDRDSLKFYAKDTLLLSFSRKTLVSTR
jgi:heat shock protein HslJ